MPERKDLPSLVHRSLTDWFSGVEHVYRTNSAFSNSLVCHMYGCH